MDGAVLAIDQGTTSSRAIVFAPDRTVLGMAQQELPQHFPAPGWVEHDPHDIWTTVVATATAALAKARLAPSAIAAIGITNQRETTLLWDRETGKPLHRAIVWQDRRTADMCRAMREAGIEPFVRERTGLLLDPYFSATKLVWLLDNVEGARTAAALGRLAFGTVDSYLLWRLTDGRVHATDATNASRTLLFNIHTQDWDDDLLRVFDIPRALLPHVYDCATYFGAVDASHFGGSGPISVRGMAGDQQAATMGQACFHPGMIKATYGTGCFAVLNTGRHAILSANRLLTTIAYRLDSQVTYALEGAIFVAGAAVQWLRDGLGLVASAREVDAMAARANPDDPVYLVPAFVGLGAPHWDPDARGAIHGLTRATGRHEIARATLESVGYQTRDLLEAMRADWPDFAEDPDAVLRVDGGMVASDWTMQFIADIGGLPVDRPQTHETTALGIAWLAGQSAGAWPSAAEFAATWQRDRRFAPAMSVIRAEEKYSGWLDAVGRTLSRPG